MRKWTVYVKPCGELALVENNQRWHSNNFHNIDDKNGQWFLWREDFWRMIDKEEWERLGEL